MLLDIGYTDSFYNKSYISKRADDYRIITIVVQLWMLIVLLIATLLISFSMLKLKEMIDYYNSFSNVYRDRFKLRTSATILHLLLLTLMLTSGIV